MKKLLFIIPLLVLFTFSSTALAEEVNNTVSWLPDNSIIIELPSDNTAPLSSKTMDEVVKKYGQLQITQTFAQWLGGCQDQKCFTDKINNYLQKQGLDKLISSFGFQYPLSSIPPLQRVYTLSWTTTIDRNAVKESLKRSKTFLNVTDDWVTGVKNFSRSSDKMATLEWLTPYLTSYFNSSDNFSYDGVLAYLSVIHPSAVAKFLDSLSGKTIAQYTTITSQECEGNQLTDDLIAGKDYVSDVVIVELLGDDTTVFDGSSVKTILTRHQSRPVLQLFDNVGKTSAEVQSYFSNILQKYSTRSERRMQGLNVPALNRFYVVKFETGSVKDVMKELCATNLFKSVSPDYYLHSGSEPNDDFFDDTAAELWGSMGDYDALWGLKKINAPDAWDITTGNSEIIIAVPDSGLDMTHEDIGDNWTTGYNFVDEGTDPIDDKGHGTHVSGIIAAEGDNSTGITGVMWNAKIMPLKISSEGEDTRTSKLVKAINYATENGADIISISVYGTEGGSALEKAVQTAYAAGIVLVSISGNEGAGVDCDEAYPGMYDEVIMVGSSDPNDERSSFSQYCDKLDLVAPGGGYEGASDPNILSLRADGTYTSGRSYTVERYYILDQGTSSAGPYVAGAVGLLLSAYPSLQIEEIRQILRMSADDIGEADGDDERDDETGYGRLDIGAAFSYVDRCYALITSPDSEAVVSGDVLSVEGYTGGDTFDNARVDLVGPDGTIDSATLSNPVDEESTLTVFDASGMTDGEYRVDLTAYDSDGNVCGADSVTLTYSTATSDESDDSSKSKVPDCGCDFGKDDVAPIDLTLFVVMLLGPVVAVRIWAWRRNNN